MSDDEDDIAVDEGWTSIDEKSVPLLAELFNCNGESIEKLALDRGIRATIWKRFWDRLFETEEYVVARSRAGENAAAQKERDLNLVNLVARLEPRVGPLKNAPPYLLGFDGSLWERHQENQLIMKEVGRYAFEAAEQKDDASAVNERLRVLKSIIIQRLAGIDLKWEGEVEDDPTARDNVGYYYRKTKPNSSKSKWGVLKVIPFPFTAIFRYDDCEEVVIFSAAAIVHNTRRLPTEALNQMERFVELNTSDKTKEERDIRLKLRSLDDVEITVEVNHPMKREVRGTFHMRLAEEMLHDEQAEKELWMQAEAGGQTQGRRRTAKQAAEDRKQKEMMKHKFRNIKDKKSRRLEQARYQARLAVQEQAKKDMRQVGSKLLEDRGDLWENPITKEVLSLAPGFFFEVSTRKPKSTSSRCAAFVCGDAEVGVHPDNFVKQIDDFSDKPQVLARESLGFKSNFFDITEPIYHKFIDPRNLDMKFVEYLQALYQTYRDMMEDEYIWKKRVLSYEFQTHVYENHFSNRQDLEENLLRFEDKDSPLIRDLVEGFQGNFIPQLQDLYERLARYDEYLMTCCWYFFWNAVEAHNRTAGYKYIAESIQRAIDPSEPGSKFGKQLTRDELVPILTEYQVYNADGAGVITDGVLDLLYAKIASLRELVVLRLAGEEAPSASLANTTAIPVVPPSAVTEIATDSTTSQPRSRPGTASKATPVVEAKETTHSNEPALKDPVPEPQTAEAAETPAVLSQQPTLTKSGPTPTPTPATRDKDKGCRLCTSNGASSCSLQ